MMRAHICSAYMILLIKLVRGELTFGSQITQNPNAIFGASIAGRNFPSYGSKTLAFPGPYVDRG